ncbi:unnamed protein product [Symbiodinium pilosum]|uniref:Uncharacterized protein n=1 Tax=Symbiodinium pilosum TaxID=2952 RepID=A0A812TSL0_SYMPI|nr:unnamed protein product [Symbiodinium pilosum]
MFFNAWANAAQLGKVENEGVDVWFSEFQHFRSTGCDLYRVTNDDRLKGSSFCGFDARAWELSGRFCVILKILLRSTVPEFRDWGLV